MPGPESVVLPRMCQAKLMLQGMQACAAAAASDIGARLMPALQINC